MKKFFLLLLLIPFNCMALEYTSYGPYKYSEKKVEASNLVEVKEEKKYKFYKEKKVYSDNFYIEDKNDPKYPYKSNIFYETEFSDYSETVPEKVKNRIIEKSGDFTYYRLNKIQYIIIDDFSITARYVELKSVNVFYGDTNLNSTHEIRGIKGWARLITSGDTIKIVLDKPYDIDQLNIELYFAETRTFTGTLKIKYYVQDEEDNPYITIDREIECLDDVNGNYKKFYVEKDDLTDEYYVETNEIGEEDSILYKIDGLVNYRYKDVLYKYYKKEKEYANGYYSILKGYNKDDYQYKIFYKYRTRKTKESSKTITSPNLTLHTTTIPKIEKIVEEKNYKNNVKGSSFDIFRQSYSIIIFLSLIALGIFLLLLLRDKEEE